MLGKSQDYGVYLEGERGPVWRVFADDLEAAKEKARQIAIEEGAEAFVFSLQDSSEVARFFPRPKPGMRDA